VKRIPIDDARDDLTDIVRAAERGEPATITRWGKPVAEVVPVGTWAGKGPAPVGIGPR
jgi:prevent-host-death family protein